MLTKEAKEGLLRILEITSPTDVKLLELKFVPGMPYSKSLGEAAEAILKYVDKPSKILCQKNMKKEIIALYLEESGVRVLKEQSKESCIRICLNKWNVKDDNFRVMQRTPKEGKTVGGTSRLDNNKTSDVKDIIRDYNIKKNRLTEILKSVERQNILRPSKKLKEEAEEEEEVQFLPHTEALTESPPQEPMESLTMNSLLSQNITQSQSSSFASASQITSHSICSAEDSSSLLSESFHCLPAVSKNQKNQAISLPLPPRCSSAPAYRESERKATLLSQAPRSSSAGTFFSRMLPPETSPTKACSFSIASLSTDHLSSTAIMESERESFPFPPNLSSVSSDRTCKTQHNSPGPLSTEPFSISTQSIQAGDLLSVGVAEDELPVSSVSKFRSSYGIDNRDHQSHEVPYPSMSNAVAPDASVSNASVQTFLSEFPKFPYNRHTVSLINRNLGKEFLSPRGNLTTNALNYKRQALKHPGKQGNLRHHENPNDSPLLPERRGNTVGVSKAKRNRMTSSSYPENCAPVGRYKSRSPLTFSECSHCKNQYFWPFFQACPNDSEVSSKHQDNKKKRPSSASNDVLSRAKYRRLTVPSNRAAEASHESPRSLTRTKVSRRNHSPSLPSEEVLPQHGSRRQPTQSSKQQCRISATSSKHHKQKTSSLKKVDGKKGKVLVKPQNKDPVSFNKPVKRKSFTSEIRAIAPASSKEYLPSSNVVNKITEPPSRSPPVPPELSSESVSKLKSQESASDTSDESDEDENPSTKDPASSLSEKPLPPRPGRRCCTLM